ncbi:MAG: hypothetical protein KAH07_01725 [Flavobacteriaceae bacterium]|nr:hypothetical protein [Flavobacteriaceae bacterium]
MILDGFKSRNVIRRIEKSLDASSEVDSLNANKIKNVLLFVEEEMNDELIKELATYLNLSKQSFKVLIFKRKIEKNESLENVISKRDFGLFGKLKGSERTDLANSSFDLLVDYTKSNEFVANFVANSKAGLKVGLLDDYSQVYDIIIDVDKSDFLSFNKELKKYLLILKKI